MPTAAVGDTPVNQSYDIGDEANKQHHPVRLSDVHGSGRSFPDWPFKISFPSLVQTTSFPVPAKTDTSE